MKWESIFSRILQRGVRFWRTRGPVVNQKSTARSPGTQARFVVLIAALCTSAQYFDIEDIWLGMPAQDAGAALRAANPKMNRTPESLSYSGFLSPLTYGIDAAGQVEGFYLLVSISPSEIVTTRAAWAAHFTEDGKAPRQDFMVPNLGIKSGPISQDTTPAALRVGTRDIFWIHGKQGQRVRGQLPPTCVSKHLQQEGPGPRAKGRDPVYSQSTMLGAQLLPATWMGKKVPNLLGYVALTIANGRLDWRSTETAHEYWLKHDEVQTVRNDRTTIEQGKETKGKGV